MAVSYTHLVPRLGVPGGRGCLRLLHGAADAPLGLVEQAAGLRPAVVHLLPVQVLPLFQLLQLGDGQVAGRPGLLDDGARCV